MHINFKKKKHILRVDFLLAQLFFSMIIGVCSICYYVLRLRGTHDCQMLACVASLFGHYTTQCSLGWRFKDTAAENFLFVTRERKNK